MTTAQRKTSSHQWAGLPAATGKISCHQQAALVTASWQVVMTGDNLDRGGGGGGSLAFSATTACT